jgi:cell division protein FtsB
VLKTIKAKEKELDNLNDKVEELKQFKSGSYYRKMGGLTPQLREMQEENKEYRKRRTKVKRELRKLETQKEKMLEL